jgi:glycine/D-amino acid oxidase-like deaminating enzyme/nitrite reductase/ring-hydroxylating ferredoxin subunit
MSYRNHSIWEATSTRPAFPPLQRDESVDVAIIGAGITGLTAALRLAKAGRTVAVLDLGGVASGATAHTSAHLTAALDRSYATLASKFGKDQLKLAVHASTTAIDRIEALVGEHGIGCGFERVPGFKFTERSEDEADLAAEAELAREVGLEVGLTRSAPLPFAHRVALRFDRQAQFHPLRYAFGLAAALAGGTCRIHAGTRVIEVEDGSPCRLRTESGHTLLAGAVFHATHTPINLVLSVHTRVAPYTSYVVAAPATAPVENALFWDTADPYHYIRRFVDGGHEYLIIGGADHKTGQEEDTRQRFAQLEEYARARFPIGPIERRWSWEVLEPADGLPYIGRMAGTENVFLATGFAGTGLTSGTIAGMVVADLIVGATSPWEELFTPARVKPVASAVEELKENANAAWRFVADRVRPPDVQRIEEIAPGEGRIVTVDGERTAAWRDEEGNTRLMSPVCTHAGCIVQWNLAERTWDCPCHGGRYHADGRVLCGPPAKDLGPGPE